MHFDFDAIYLFTLFFLIDFFSVFKTQKHDGWFAITFFFFLGGHCSVVRFADLGVCVIRHGIYGCDTLICNDAVCFLTDEGEKPHLLVCVLFFSIFYFLLCFALMHG